MTIDERIEFLLQSTESLHASTQTLSWQMAQHNQDFRQYRQETERRFQQLADAILPLIRLVQDHEARITELEEPKENK